MEGEFHGIDLLFAEKLTTDPQGQELLAKLLRSVREGELFYTLRAHEREVAMEKLAFLLDKKIVLEGQHLYLKRHHALTTRFYAELARIKAHSPKKEVGDVPIEGLNEAQKEVVHACKEHSFWIITGGPGTGKSYTLAHMIRHFSKTLSIILTAPTGKAAARMREPVPEGNFSAMTLHKLLKVGSIDSAAQLDCDMLLVDESSMVDVTLFTKLLSCVRGGMRLVLVGDHEQLPPVEGASYFRQLVEGGKEGVSFLTHSLRTENDEILELARKAKHGEPLSIKELLSPEKLVRSVEERVLLREGDSFEKMNACKILTPFRQGQYGVEALNERFYARQQQLYPYAPVPIMVSVNDERLGVYNGDVGLLRKKEVFFADGRSLPLYCLRGYELAYVLSVHKSQGSEYGEVILLLPPGTSRFGKQLLYTAITRAKRSVEILGVITCDQ